MKASEKQSGAYPNPPLRPGGVEGVLSPSRIFPVKELRCTRFLVYITHRNVYNGHMKLMAQVWVCDQCKHAWLMGPIVPTHCAKCRSRRWNSGRAGSGKEIEPSRSNRVEAHAPAPRDSGDKETGDRGVGRSNERSGVDMAALREICAGNVNAGPDAADTQEAIARQPRCVVCDEPMREVKAKWACADVSCAKYGVEQKARKR